MSNSHCCLIFVQGVTEETATLLYQFEVKIVVGIEEQRCKELEAWNQVRTCSSARQPGGGAGVAAASHRR